MRSIALTGADLGWVPACSSRVPRCRRASRRARCVPRRRSSRCSIEFSLRTSGVESLLLLVLLLSDHIVALVVAIGGVQRGEREAPCEGGGVGPQWTGFGASIRSADRKNGIHIDLWATDQYGYAWFCSFREKRSLDGSRVRKQSFIPKAPLERTFWSPDAKRSIPILSR